MRPHGLYALFDTAEGRRLSEIATGTRWRRWGPYLAERQWDTGAYPMKMVHPASGLRIAGCETLPISIERDITARKIVGSGLPEKFPDYLFLVLVIAFAEVVVAQATARVGEIVRWPKFIGEVVPYR